jgi:hypothetical protein
MRGYKRNSVRARRGGHRVAGLLTMGLAGVAAAESRDPTERSGVIQRLACGNVGYVDQNNDVTRVPAGRKIWSMI